MLDLAKLTQAPDPLAYFSLLVKSDANFPLFEAMVSIAQDEEETLDVQAVLGQMDQLQAKLKRRIAADAPALQKLLTLNYFFYRELGFGGNANDYYAPDNSFIHAVLRTRRGIPISVAVIWLELAQSIGIKASGISFPGHFLLKVMLPGQRHFGHIIMDPLNAQSLTGQDLYQRLAPLRAKMALEDDQELPLGLYLQDASPREILARALRNLQEIYRGETDWDRFICVLDRLIMLYPQDWPQYRDRGEAHYKRGNPERAVKDLDTYLARAEYANDRERVLITRSQALSQI